jgi:AcrR family transcriptional regulator
MSMAKGSNTKNDIINRGLEMASQLGLECITIGLLAKETNLSKSGLFAHFKSKENLQMEILKYAADDFTQKVIHPALKVSAGVARIKALVKNWIEWGNKISGGCIFVSAGIEYSDRPGKIRNLLIQQQEQWIDSLRRIANSAIKAGEFKTGIDADQFAFDLYSLLLGFHYYYKLLDDKKVTQRQELALEQLLVKYKS